MEETHGRTFHFLTPGLSTTVLQFLFFLKMLKLTNIDIMNIP